MDHELKPPRLMGWLLISLALLVAVWALAPQQLPVSLYKLSLVTLAAVVGYWLDRSLFPYARPDAFLDSSLLPDEDAWQEPRYPGDELSGDMALGEPVWDLDDGSQGLVFAACMLRRAVIVGCAMLAMGLGA